MNKNSSVDHTLARPLRGGQALVEFAIISFVLTAMLAGFLGIIVMGLGSFQNNIAAESAGRLLDQHRVFIKEHFASHFNDPDSDDFFDPASDDFQEITARQVFRFLNEYPIDDDGNVLYDENRLVISREDWDSRDSIGLPAINQALLGQYIFDPALDAYRFPGAVVDNQRTGGKTVLIPLLPNSFNLIFEPNPGIDRSFYVTSSDPVLFYPVSDDWVAPVVIEKVQNGDDFDFRIIMFHPSQPASTIQIRVNRDENGRPDRDADGFYQFPVEADDDAIDALIGDPPSEYTLTTPVNSSGRAFPYGGKFGLGESFAFLKTVRPYRAVFETASLFRMGASPITVKYEYAADGNPGPTLANASDQALEFERMVIDRSNVDLRRYIVDPSAPDDFSTNMLKLRPNDDGVWRVSVVAEFEAPSWEPNHVLQLRLYKNGASERLITTHNVTSAHSERISITGHAITEAKDGDILQVRVFTERASGNYEVLLTGDPASNWVSFERVGS